MEPQEGLPCVQEYALRATGLLEEMLSGKGQDSFRTAPSEPNTTWSLDFVGDVLECGRRFGILNTMDDSD